MILPWAIGQDLIDTGASRTIVSEEIARQIGGPIKDNITYAAAAVSGNVTINHQIETPVSAFGLDLGTFEVLVSKDPRTFKKVSFDTIMGYDILTALPMLLLDFQEHSVGIVPKANTGEYFATVIEQSRMKRQKVTGVESCYGFWPSKMSQTQNKQSSTTNTEFNQTNRSYLNMAENRCSVLREGNEPRFKSSTRSNGRLVY